MLGRTLPVLCVPSRGQSQGAWADGPCRERFEPVKEPSAGIGPWRLRPVSQALPVGRRLHAMGLHAQMFLFLDHEQDAGLHVYHPVSPCDRGAQRL